MNASLLCARLLQIHPNLNNCVHCVCLLIRKWLTRASAESWMIPADDGIASVQRGSQKSDFVESRVSLARDDDGFAVRVGALAPVEEH